MPLAVPAPGTAGYTLARRVENTVKMIPRAGRLGGSPTVGYLPLQVGLVQTGAPAAMRVMGLWSQTQPGGQSAWLWQPMAHVEEAL